VHGALLSFAREQGLAIRVLPHSRVYNVAHKTDGLALTCLHHGLQDGPALDLAGHALPSAQLSYPGAWTQQVSAQDSVKTLGVILNGISANGMCVVNFDEYLNGLRQIQAWAKAQGVRLRWRVRAVETPVMLVVQALQLPLEEVLVDCQGSLLEFARQCDVCLGYDVPTSGLQDLVREGLAVLQAEYRPLARYEWAIVDASVIPRTSLPEALERVAVMQANPAVFQSFKRKQHQAALQSQIGARALRHCLTPTSAL
jgi:hypothetical protein